MPRKKQLPKPPLPARPKYGAPEPSRNPYKTDPTSAYAWDVVNKKIVAGDLARRACQRHLDDIKHGPRRGIHWKHLLANKALEFFPTVLRVTAGAHEGEPFNLPHFSTFVIGSLYGWVRDDGRLRYRTAWIEAGKGSMKSPLAAAIGLYTMAFRGIPRAECYAIAKDRQQANVLFGDAVAMAQAPIADRDDDASLVSTGMLVARGTGGMTWQLEHSGPGGGTCIFRALAGDEKVSGPRPSLVAADEIHDWKTDGPLRTWRSAGAKMPGDFLLFMSTNTPAADQLVGTEYSESYQRILRGEVDDDSAFAYIARVDPTDDPLNDEKCWPKALPLLDITFPRENVKIEVNSSKHSVGTLLNTKRLYFGIPVGSSEYWIDIDAWEAVQAVIDEELMRGLPCWLGMDLARKNDLTALGAVWRDDDGMLFTKATYWKPAEGLAQDAVEDSAPYVQWAAEDPPLLLTTPSAAMNYDFVAAEVERFCALHDVQGMAFDPAHIGEFRNSCERIGFPTWIWTPETPYGDGLKMIIHSQGRAGMHSKKALWMPRSLGQFEDLILNRKIWIDRSQITQWCSGNAAVKADEQGNRYFKKKVMRGRIDGLVAITMATGMCLYEDGGIPLDIRAMVA